MWNARIEQVQQGGTASLIPALPPRWFSDDFIAKDPAAVKRTLDMVVATDDSSYIKTCQALGNFDARPYLSDIAVPLLVISGEVDPGSPPAVGAHITKDAPHSQQIVTTGASHMAAVEAPLEVAKEIVTFLTS
jgi:pimeloyl-ACP methyl ester carboxylesterase